MLDEEFKRCINSDVKSFLDEKEVETLEKAARLADDYTLAHKVSFVNKANPRKPFYQVLVSNLVIPIRMLPNPNILVKTKITIPYLSLFAIIANNQFILFLTVLFCKENGKSNRVLKPTGLTSLKLTSQSCVKDQTPVQAKVPESDNVMEIYEPFYQMVLCH